MVSQNGKPELSDKQLAQALRRAQRQQKLAEANLQTSFAKRQQAMLEGRTNSSAWFAGSQALMEGAANVPDWAGNYQAYLERFKDGDEFWIPIAGYKYDRKAGQNFPFWITEWQLTLLRAQARLLCSENPYAIGLLEGLTSFVIGDGYQYRVTSKEAKRDLGLIGEVQDFIDDWMDDVDFLGLEEELFWRSCEDGEFFVWTGIDDDDPWPWIRTVEPEQIVQPKGSKLPTDGSRYEIWGYGVHTPEDDVQNVLGYWVESYLERGETWGEEIDVSEIVHLKRNVKRSIKRGLTDFSFQTLDALQDSGKLMRNMVNGASIQASLAMIRQHEQASSDAIQAFAATQPEIVKNQPLSGRNINLQRYDPGTILDVGKGYTYMEPPSAENADKHVQVLQAGLRAACVRWNAPEWLGSSDASNENRASARTAKTPFAMKVRREQRRYKRSFRAILWRVISLAVEAGILPSQVLTALMLSTRRPDRKKRRQDLVQVQVEAPVPEEENSLEKAQENQILNGMGVKSQQTIAQEMGLDWEQEAKNREEYDEQFGGLGDQLPMPGEDGKQGTNGRPPARKPKPAAVPESYESSPVIDEPLLAQILTVMPPQKPPREQLPWLAGKIQLPDLGEFKVLLVDGDKIRNEPTPPNATRDRMDFVAAGNGYEDPSLCAKDEIVVDWLDSLTEWAHNTYHEGREIPRLVAGMDYDTAHALTNPEEKLVIDRLLQQARGTAA